MSTETQTPTSTWDQIKVDSKNLLSSLTAAVDQTAEHLSKLVLVRLDEDERQKIAQLVKSNIVQNQSEGIRFLVQAGIEARGDIFTRVSQTNTEIDGLKDQLKMKFASKQVE